MEVSISTSEISSSIFFFLLHLKKAGLASRNIVHDHLKPFYVRSVSAFISIIFFILCRLDHKFDPTLYHQDNGPRLRAWIFNNLFCNYCSYGWLVDKVTVVPMQEKLMAVYTLAWTVMRMTKARDTMLTVSVSITKKFWVETPRS